MSASSMDVLIALFPFVFSIVGEQKAARNKNSLESAPPNLVIILCFDSEICFQLFINSALQSLHVYTNKTP